MLTGAIEQITRINFRLSGWLDLNLCKIFSLSHKNLPKLLTRLIGFPFEINSILLNIQISLVIAAVPRGRGHNLDQHASNSPNCVVYLISGNGIATGQYTALHS